MTIRYTPLLNAIKAQLAVIAPGRLVTRNWSDFDAVALEKRKAGVLHLGWGGVASYPYEASDNQFDDSALRATANGRMVISITAKRQLHTDCKGEDIDLAEDEMLGELEQLADDAMELPGLHALLLKRAVTSQQVESPYAWVVTYWEVFPVN